MTKILLADNGKGRGLYFSPDNNMKFIVAGIEDNNGIGNPVSSWHWGNYFNTLDEAYKEYKK